MQVLANLYGIGGVTASNSLWKCEFDRGDRHEALLGSRRQSREAMTSSAAELAEAYDELKGLRTANRDRFAARRPLLSRASLEPVLAGLGITRVGDLTGLDDLDIPVWFAARPASRSLCVSNGKGVTHEAAWISAVMESAEQAIAEEASALVALVESPAGLARRGLRSVPLERQSRCAARRLSPEQNLAWVKGMSWATGEAVFAPYELVGMDMVTSAPWDVEHFRMTSLGLASGCDLEGAILHGLRELVEEDAMFGPLASGAAASRRDMDFRRHGADGLAWTIDRLAESGVEARFADVTDEIAMPAVLAALRPRQSGTSDPAGPSDPAYFCGSACRSTVEDAALAALLEAVQSRLTFISGARDDLYADEYGRRLKPGTQVLFGGYNFTEASIGDGGTEIGQSELDRLTAKVFAADIPDIYVFPLGGRSHGFDVARILADDLVSLQDVDGYARSGRAGRKLLRQWVRA